MLVNCSRCGIECEKETGHVNRANKLGMKMFCSRECFGLGSRVDRSNEEKKKNKAAYDKIYRATNPTLKQRKSDYHKKNYDSEKQKVYNKIRYPKHLEYLQRPEYKEYKKDYDEKYRAAKLYGEFSEAAIILKRLEDILDSKKIKHDEGITFNKSTQQRKRKWQQLNNLKN